LAVYGSAARRAADLVNRPAAGISLIEMAARQERWPGKRRPE
jgi:hypothetical protein